MSDISLKEIEKIVALTMNQLTEMHDVDLTEFGSATVREIAEEINSELNTVVKPPVRIKVLAVGTENVIIVFAEDGGMRTKGQREEIPLKYSYINVKDGDYAWAQYRSNPSWGRWYLEPISPLNLNQEG